MCGIVGIATLDPSAPPESAAMRPMLERVRRRGPDGEGIHAVAGAVLGVRRLAIIDLERGNQPLRGAHPETAIVVNGEVYNFRELAAALPDGGRSLRTGSDAEVAAHAYDAWGLDFLDRLEGMYAIALWDGRRRRLVLARDRLGEKPLYYGVSGGRLAFASDLRAVLACPGFPAEIDFEALASYLVLEYVPAPRSILRGIAKLPPATALVLEDGRIEMRPYWRLADHLSAGRGSSPPPREGHASYGAAVRRLREILDRAVGSRLVSDVPRGIFLSGGVDSATVAALAARRGPVETFSVGLEDRAFDERPFSRLVASRLGSRHHERLLRIEDILTLVPRLPQILDEPLGDASILPTALLSAFARERVTVALGGEGGDELFAGYPMHRGHRVAPFYRALPRPARAAIRGLARWLPVRHGNFTFPFKVTRFLRGADLPAPENHILWMSSFSGSELARLLTPEAFAAAGGAEAPSRTVAGVWAESAGAQPLARATHLDARTYLPDDILMKVDRAGMAVALEVRSPFLCRELVEFAMGLPDAWRMRGLTGKRILRDAVRGLVPPEILRRPKMGFGVPMGAWLRGPLRPLCRELLSPAAVRSAGLFQAGEVERLVRDHEEGRADNRKPLWTLMVFELWRRGLPTRAPGPQ
jgi:asparagine synthase (glutamine-hydrolysing)